MGYDIEKFKQVCQQRIENNDRTTKIHGDLLSRELSRARADAYRNALADLENCKVRPAEESARMLVEG